MRVTLVNHACVKIHAGQRVILTDPWLEGPAFNFGWDLLIPTPQGFDEVVEGVTHIWVSHEHPDHFAPKFFSDLAGREGKKPVILFQATRDQRVAAFCRAKGFEVLELPNGAPVDVGGGVEVLCGQMDFYDSWLRVRDGKETLLNLNDCVFTEPRDIAALARRVGPVDVLLTQFSYAAWKGGRENARFRRDAAQAKLDTIRKQIAGLKPGAVIPFASFAYFSSVENSYLNDHVNQPADAAAAIRQAGAEPVVLFPGDSWSLGEPHENAPVLARFAAAYQADRPLRETPSVSLAQLEQQFAGYRERIFKDNSRPMIETLRRVPLLGAFSPVTIAVTDIGEVVSVSVVDGFRRLDITPSKADVSMHSSSLAFIFAQPFGYDTLTVNGRFEATPIGFEKMTKSFGIGSLNAMGLAVKPSLLFNAQVIGLLLVRLAGVMSRLRGRKDQADAASAPNAAAA